MGKGVAEDTPEYRRCKRGHAMIPENIYLYPNSHKQECRACRKERGRIHRAKRRESIRAYMRAWMRAHPESRSKYNHSEKNRQAQARWNATTRAWASKRRYELKGQREAIAEQLSVLKREEEECRTLLARVILTKSSGSDRSSSPSNAPSGD